MLPLLACIIESALVMGQSPPAQQPAPNQTPDQGNNTRDLKPVHPPENVSISPGSVPQSYALVIGVAHYQGLPDSAQLRYQDRDAEAI